MRVGLALGQTFQFDNGVRLLRTHLEPEQLTRYPENPIVLHEPHEERWFTSLLFASVGAAGGIED